jgi:hypothetical protein
VAATQELEALAAIYGGDSLVEDAGCRDGHGSVAAAIGAEACGEGCGGSPGVDHGSVCLEIVSPRDWCFRLGGGATLEVFIPRGYPSREPPTPLLHCDWLDSHGRAEMVGRLLAMHCGAEVVFEWVEMLRTELGEALDAREAPIVPAGDGGTLCACSVAQSSCDTSLERGEDCSASPDTGPSFAAAAALGQGSLLGNRDSHGGYDVTAGADGATAADSGSGFYFEPSTSGLGERVRRFGPEAMSSAHEVKVIHGEPFTPPGKSVRSRHATEITKTKRAWAGCASLGPPRGSGGHDVALPKLCPPSARE